MGRPICRIDTSGTWASLHPARVFVVRFGVGSFIRGRRFVGRSGRRRLVGDQALCVLRSDIIVISIGVSRTDNGMVICGASFAMALAAIKSPSTTPTMTGCPAFIAWCSLMRGLLWGKPVWPRAGGSGVPSRTEQAAHGTSRKPFPIVTVLLSDHASTPIYTKRGKSGTSRSTAR